MDSNSRSSDSEENNVMTATQRLSLMAVYEILEPENSRNSFSEANGITTMPHRLGFTPFLCISEMMPTNDASRWCQLVMPADDVNMPKVASNRKRTNVRYSRTEKKIQNFFLVFVSFNFFDPPNKSCFIKILIVRGVDFSPTGFCSNLEIFWQTGQQSTIIISTRGAGSNPAECRAFILFCVWLQ